MQFMLRSISSLAVDESVGWLAGVNLLPTMHGKSIEHVTRFEDKNSVCPND